MYREKTRQILRARTPLQWSFLRPRLPVERYHPKEYIELDRLRNVDAAMDLAVEFDFIDEDLAEDELDELLSLDSLPP